MKIESPSFQNGQKIPSKYTCDGEDVNPPLVFSGIPDGTKSLALIVDDPDAPRGTWVHWTIWNIDPVSRGIGENSIPEGATEGVTSFGRFGYGGPCPPSGSHRYFFKLYALDARLDIKAETGVNSLEMAIKSHILGKAELVGLYSSSL